MLHDFQQQMAARLRPGCAADPLLPVMAGPAARIARGWRVYANNVAHAHVESLRAAYPVTAELVGNDCFVALALDFAACEAATPVLRGWTRRLPGHLDGHALGADLPWLADLARVELAWLDAHDAADTPPLHVPQDADALAVARLILHPGATVIRSAHPVHSIWRWQRGGGGELADRPEAVALFRPAAEILDIALPHAVANRLPAPGWTISFDALAEGLCDTDILLLGELLGCGLLGVPHSEGD